MSEDFIPYPAHPGDKCFACGRAIGRLAASHEVDTRDGQTVFVGSDCFKRITESGVSGFQPPKGGPRLYPMGAP